MRSSSIRRAKCLIPVTVIACRAVRSSLIKQATSFLPPVGRGFVVAPLPEMAGVGWLMLTGYKLTSC
jgi:hypothetical protein